MASRADYEMYKDLEDWREELSRYQEKAKDALDALCCAYAANMDGLVITHHEAFRDCILAISASVDDVDGDVDACKKLIKKKQDDLYRLLTAARSR